jgi:uncharacterized membrane protein
MNEKNLQLERLLFFSDAVVAIAITLLALDLKIEHTPTGHLQFSDLLDQWKTFAAFLLSFINIANFWRTNHLFFGYIKSIDDRLVWFGIGWLLFIVTLPFTTSLVSSYFFDTPAIFAYSLNMLMVAIFQNAIWDYATYKSAHVDEGAVDSLTGSHLRVYCNLDMINGLLAVGLSFMNPALAFILLFTKLPMFVITWFIYRPKPSRRPQADWTRKNRPTD